MGGWKSLAGRSFLMFHPIVKSLQKIDDEDASCSGSSSNNSADGDDKDGDKDSKKKKNRCATCRKKVGLTGKCCTKF